jgi:FlaA1/EpsC-like NDP-sugar epimerase
MVERDRNAEIGNLGTTFQSALEAVSFAQGPEVALTRWREAGNGEMPRGLWWTKLLTRQTQIVLDLSVLIAAFILSYLLRFDFAVPEREYFNGAAQIGFVVAIEFVALFVTGVYAFIWRYVGISDLKAFVRSAILAMMPLLVFRLASPPQLEFLRVPLPIIVMDAILAFGGVLGIRVLRRALYEKYEHDRAAAHCQPADRKPVLLIGAGRAGIMAAKEIVGRGDTELDIKGFVDDDPTKSGSVIHGITVLGGMDRLAALVSKYQIDHVVITIAEASPASIRGIVRVCESIPVKARIIPRLYEIIGGKVEISRMRDVQIEDLLGREAVQLDEESVGQLLAGRTVMITGAGGSIGSELVRQATRFNPDRLLLVERSEFALFNVERELRESHPEMPVLPLLADIGDEPRMRHIFAAHQPHVVLHAAAHKHVPMMEFNTVEAVKNNVIGTQVLGRIAGEFGVGVFVLISTDKAVRPSSIMGASKRVAELAIQDLNKRFPTRYVAVRFGNVIGSAGSVIPIFQEQIMKGGPVKITHPDMTRYFMTISEAAQLVLQAAAIGEGGEIFILDMGEPVRIVDLARDLITLSGLKPHEDIDIIFTGIRHGEKLVEELQTDTETLTKTRHPKIYIGRCAAYPKEKVRIGIRQLATLAAQGLEVELRNVLTQLLPEAQLAGEPGCFPARPDLSMRDGDYEVGRSFPTLSATPMANRERRARVSENY